MIARLKSDSLKMALSLTGVCLFTLLLVFLAEKRGPIFLLLPVGALFGIFFVTVSFVKPRYNFPLLFAIGFLTPLIMRMLRIYDYPHGLVNELVLILMILTLIANKRIGGAKSFPAILLFAWLSYMLIEIINPYAASRTASVLGIRSFVPLFFGYFIFYSSINSKRDARVYVWSWFLLTLLAGIYGIFQEFNGLPPFDHYYATANEKIYGLLFTWGRFRKFSFFYSPTEFGILTALTGVAALTAFIYFRTVRLRIFLAATSLISFWAMLYTGSRTSMVLIPIGLIFLILITFNRYVILLSVVIGLAGAAFIFKPGGNAALYVMSTAFSGKDDPSMNVRLVNQQLIRSYIRSQPIGFGLGSTGYLGRKYSPDTFIGTFPPDSEYVKIAIETGWVGLFIYCLLLALCFSYGVRVYFKLRDSEWKGHIVISLVTQLIFMVAFYPQEIFTSYILTLIFIASIAMTAKVDFLISRTTSLEANEDEASQED